MDHSLSIPTSSYRHFSSLARRLGRIFAHAYFHHREAFEQAEAESSLYARFLALTSKFDLVPAEFLVIPPSHTDDAGRQQVEPPRLLGAALDPHRRQEDVSGREDPNSKQDFVELSLEPNAEGSSDLLRSPAGSDGQRRRNRTDTMIFSEAVNIAEDLAKAQTETELEGSTPFTEVPAIDEVTGVPLISEAVSSAGDTAPAENDPSLEFDDPVLTDEVEEIPLPSVTDSEPVPLEDSGEESSDEEVVPEEEIPDPAVAEPPVPSEIPVSEPPSTIPAEPIPPETASDEDEKEPELTRASEPAQLMPKTSEPPTNTEVALTTTDDEDVEEDEEEPTLAPGPSSPEVTDDNDEEEDDGSQPASQPEVAS